MAKITFDTNPVLLQSLLKTCEDGKLQLPDFQRSMARVSGLELIETD